MQRTRRHGVAACRETSRQRLLGGPPQWPRHVETYDDTVPPRRGVSLAKGPVAIIGIASLALGILGFIFADQSFTFDAPSGTVEGATFLGIEGNGWTWVVFAAAGLLLLLGSPIHWGAKSMAFIVGVVMVVGALISLSDGDDILGVVATNNWTTLIMGAGRRRADPALDDAARRPRRGGAPMATREERVVDERPRRFGREPRPSSPRVATRRSMTAPSRTGTAVAHGTLEDDRRRL